MGMIDGMIPEFEHEAALTREVLLRVPEEKWEYKPHEKSMSMRELASHLAENPMWAEGTIEQDVMEIDTATYKSYVAADTTEMMKTFDGYVAAAKKAMAGVTDEQLLATWKMVDPAGNVMLEMPRIAVLRSFVISHTIHHRGQLTVYLRMQDVPLPSIYGPSADEQG